MSRRMKRLSALIVTLTWLGWFSYPGWYYEWYSTAPENYAFPASMSNQCDPKWGFWFW